MLSIFLKLCFLSQNRTGFKDENNVVTDLILPGPFAMMAGIEIHDWDPGVN
jgi:hypothetical protein